MSKLDELIAEFCSDGVEFKTLGEISQISRGASPRPIKNFITENPDGVNWIKIGDVTPGFKYITETKEKITKAGAAKSRYVKPGDFILSNSMSFGRPYILKIDGCIHDGWLSISGFEKELLSDFLYYILVSTQIQQEMSKRASFGGAVQNLNADIVRDLKVPVPPLEVQREIVRVLDNFTFLSAELLARLSAELSARRKQYDYYSNKLLEFSDVRYYSLSDLCDVVDYRGKTPRKSDTGVFLVTAKNIRQGYIDYGKSQEYIPADTYNEVMHRGFPKIGDVLITTEAPCGYVAQVDREDIALAQRVIKYRPKDPSFLDATFLKYILLGKEFQRKLEKASTGGTVKGIKGSILHTLTIPVPEIGVQKKTVELLNHFDSLCHSITDVLPAEIEARQQQCDYYRDKLLTFKIAEDEK